MIEARLNLKWEDHHYFYLLKDIEILDRAGFEIAKSQVKLNYAEGPKSFNEFYYLQDPEHFQIPILERNLETNLEKDLEKFYGKI